MLWCSSSQTVSLPEVSHSSPQKSPFVSGSITIFIADPPWPAPWGPPGPPVAPGGGRCFLVVTLGSFWSRNGILQTRGWPGIPTEKLGTTNKMVMDCFTCGGDCGSIIIIYYYYYLLLLLYIYMQPTKMRPYENEMFRPNFMVTSMGKAENYEIWG